MEREIKKRSEWRHKNKQDFGQNWRPDEKEPRLSQRYFERYEHRWRKKIDDRINYAINQNPGGPNYGNYCTTPNQDYYFDGLIIGMAAKLEVTEPQVDQ